MTRAEFTEFVRDSQEGFRRFLTALCCGDTALADDIAQEAYVKAWLSSEGFRNQSKFQTWLFRIGYNTFIDHRRSGRLPALNTIGYVTAGYDAAATVAAPDSADSAFRYQHLYAALSRLSDAERTAVLLFYMQGYATAEIAALTGATDAAVRQHLSRARRHLRQSLTP